MIYKHVVMIIRVPNLTGSGIYLNQGTQGSGTIMTLTMPCSEMVKFCLQLNSNYCIQAQLKYFSQVSLKDKR